MAKHTDRQSDIVSNQGSHEDETDITLRPSSFDDFTGQAKIIENLKIDTL